MQELEIAIGILEGLIDAAEQNSGVFLPVSTVQGITDAIALLKAPAWISVKDGLPDKAGRYIITALERGEYVHVTTAIYGRRFNMTGRMAHWRVTHWMPLPEPPKEG